jgi:glucosamine--fructose-6-phosphate aminotransferase (isomerizing)
VLSDFDSVRRRIPPLRADRLAIVARGLCLAAAKETALKLQETTGIMAHAFSTADFRHGPIAVCGPSTPAILIAGSGPADGDTAALQTPLAGRNARSVIVGSVANADITFPADDGGLECLLATIRGQQLALALSRDRGIDPDAPGGLNKVTLTY